MQIETTMNGQCIEIQGECSGDLFNNNKLCNNPTNSHIIKYARFRVGSKVVFRLTICSNFKPLQTFSNK